MSTTYVAMLAAAAAAKAAKAAINMESGWRVEGFDGEWMEGGGF